MSTVLAPTHSNAANILAIKPPGKMTNSELIAFLRSRAYLSSPLYAEDFSRFRKGELYDQSDQWNRRSYGTSNSMYPAQWKRLEYNANDPNAVPLPVLNEGVLLRENESARLGRPEYKPRVKPSGSNPGIEEKEGAKGSERALSSRLKEMWSDEEDKLYLHLPLYGGAWLKSTWDQTWMQTVRVPAPSLCCPRHPKSGVPQEKQGPPPLAGLQMPGSEIGEMQEEMPGTPGLPGAEEPGEFSPSLGLAGTGMGGPLGPSSAPVTPVIPPCSYCRKADPKPGQNPSTSGTGPLPSPGPNPDQGRCPVCPDHPALVPFSPTLEEALDPNLDLGMDVPEGDWFLTVPYPYMMFVRDAGVGVNPTDVDEWLEVYTKPISWAEERWPDKIRDASTGQLRVHPQNPATLMSENPTLGSPDILQYAQHAGVFRSHVVVYEYNRKPWLEWDEEKKSYSKNKGRTVIGVVGAGSDGVICLDDALLIESLNKPGTFVPRTHLQFVVWEKRDGGRRSTVGQSLWDRIFDAQDGINERISQVRAVNQRSALPWYLQRAGINMETRSADAAVPMRRVIADIDPNDRNLPLTLLNNTTIDQGVYNELGYYGSFLGKNVVEVEKGQVPPGVAAATAIAYLKTESGEKRRPRILRIRRALARSWEHGLRLMSARYIEDRPYTYEDEEDSEERSAFIRGDVIAKSNPKVDIYPTPDYDITDARRESIRDQVQLGILNPAQTPQLARKISSAMDESLEFFLDDDLQEQQAQREWRDFKETGIVPVIDPSLDDPLTHYQEHGRACFTEWFRDKESQAQWDQALAIIGASWEEGLQIVAQIATNPAMLQPQQPQPMQPGMQPGMAPPPPQPAPPPMPTPSLDKLILRQWTLKLQQSGMTSLSPILERVVLPWRAHMEAHKLQVEIKQMKDQMRQAASVPAPATGSAPTSDVEAQVQQGGAPQPPGM